MGGIRLELHEESFGNTGPWEAAAISITYYPHVWERYITLCCSLGPLKSTYEKLWTYCARAQF